MTTSRRVTAYRRGEPVEIELVPIGNGQWLEREAGEAFLVMQELAATQGIALVPNSGHREHAHQKRLRARYERRLLEWQTAPVSERGPRPNPAALAGWSNHEAGIAVDINRNSGDDPWTIDPDSPVDLWLKSNSARYGFIRTVKVEPWHFEYHDDVATLAKLVS